MKAQDENQAVAFLAKTVFNSITRDPESQEIAKHFPAALPRAIDVLESILLQAEDANHELHGSQILTDLETRIEWLQSQRQRPIHQIAREIKSVWTKPYFGAVPYLNVMIQLASVHDSYIVETGQGIVNGFLANASTWRGEDARRIKAELKALR